MEQITSRNIHHVLFLNVCGVFCLLYTNQLYTYIIGVFKQFESLVNYYIMNQKVTYSISKKVSKKIRKN